MGLCCETITDSCLETYYNQFLSYMDHVTTMVFCMHFFLILHPFNIKKGTKEEKADNIATAMFD